MDRGPSYQLNPNVVLKLLQAARDEASRGPGATADAKAELKLTTGAVQTLAELCRLLVVSARARAEREARNDGCDAIAPEHVEAIMAELLTDF